MKKPKYMIIVEYLANYKVKYRFFNEPIREDEGGGWYSISGYELKCGVSKLHPNNPTDYLCSIEDLPEDHLTAFKKEQLRYESSKIHRDRYLSAMGNLKKKNMLDELL